VTSFYKEWRKAIVQENSTIEQAINNLNQLGIKIVLVVDKTNKLIGTISDGDIRRGLLRDLDLNSSIVSILHSDPLVVPPELPKEMVRQLMVANKIHQIPVIDRQKHVIGLHIWNEVVNTSQRANIMVIMAGGKGTRLLPYTENCPKPMVLVAGKPMLEHIIERAKLEGFTKFLVAIHYLGYMIEEYFGNGEWLGVKIDYLREKSPLGTAGALGLVNTRPDVPLVVTNGDVITDIRYGELLDFHIRNKSTATMAVRSHEWQHPFGVVQIRDSKIVGFEEKPITRSYINAGIYVLSPEVLREFKPESPCDMPMIFELLQAKANHTFAYPMHEPWLDVGRPDDLIQANSDISQL